MLNCSTVQCQVPAAAGDGASVNAVKSRDLAVGRSRARRAVGCRWQREVPGPIHLSWLWQELHVEARSEHSQETALWQGTTLPVPTLPQAVLSTWQSRQPHQKCTSQLYQEVNIFITWTFALIYWNFVRYLGWLWALKLLPVEVYHLK